MEDCTDSGAVALAGCVTDPPVHKGLSSFDCCHVPGLKPGNSCSLASEDEQQQRDGQARHDSGDGQAVQAHCFGSALVFVRSRGGDASISVVSDALEPGAGMNHAVNHKPTLQASVNRPAVKVPWAIHEIRLLLSV